MTEQIYKYFGNLTERQKEQIELLDKLYRDWNSKINVISRKDIDNLYEHHVLHSLAIAKETSFSPGTDVLDFGTGGGFTGIPLAILFPEVNFTLIDGTGKKVMVASEVAKALQLTNVTALHRRGEEEKGKYDFIVSRAVMPLPDLAKIVRKNISKTQRNSHPNGIFCLKGGDLTHELAPFGRQAMSTPITNYFKEEWFKGKFIAYVQM